MKSTISNTGSAIIFTHLVSIQNGRFRFQCVLISIEAEPKFTGIKQSEYQVILGNLMIEAKVSTQITGLLPSINLQPSS